MSVRTSYFIRSGILKPLECFENRSDAMKFMGFSDITNESILDSLEAFLGYVYIQKE